MNKQSPWLDGKLGIDPERLLLLDKRVVITIRAAGLIFSIALAALAFLSLKTAHAVPGIRPDIAMWLSISILLLGLVETLWNPFTYRKVSFYLHAYTFQALAFSLFVFGYSTMMMLSWSILMMISVIFFGWKRALLEYCLLIFSIAAWLLVKWNDFTLIDILTYVLGTIAAGIMWLFTLSVWSLTNKTIRDVEAAQQEQESERSQLLALVNSLNIAIVTIRPTGKIRLYNAAFLGLLDTNVSLQGKSISKILQLVEGDGHPFSGSITDEMHPVERDDLVMKVGDDTMHLLISSAPIRSAGHTKPEGFVIVLRDITKMKSLEEERDEFISVVSHELRTPVAITEGAVSNSLLLAERSADSNTLQPILKSAHDQVIYLAEMINNLGTLSRAERGVGDDLEDINLTEFIQSIYNKYIDSASTKGLSLNLDHLPVLGTLHTSRLYLEEILQNFITNAIKYTKEGSVTIGARRTSSAIEFTVSDTGIGISRSDQKHVMEKFYRSEDYRTRESGGTGLGLYVTKKLADKLEATISIKSRLNHGSTFTISIPRTTQKE